VFLGVEGYLLVDMANRSGSSPTPSNGNFLLVLAATVAAVGAVMLRAFAIALRQPNIRIGTDGRNVLFDPGTGKIEFCDIACVLVSGTTLLIGTRIVSSHTQNGKPIYPLEPFQALILARIPHQNFIKPLQFGYQALKRGNTIAWTIALFVALFLILEVFPWFSQLRPPPSSISLSRGFRVSAF